MWRLVKFFTKSRYTDGRYSLATGLTVARIAGKHFEAYCAMGKKQSSFSFRRSAESLQDNVQRAGPAAGASYTLIGAIIYGQVLSFGILLMPRFSLFAVFALMAVILVVRPYGLLGHRAASRA